jgi:phosphatidylglycerophosphatase A
MRRFILVFSSNFGLGYCPMAPGTFGTLAGVPAFFFLSRLSPAGRGAVLAALLLFSFWIAEKAGKIYGLPDDKRIVIDEMVGYLVSVLWFPFSWRMALAGFAFFRFFDVTKPPPASWLDRNLKNGFGVVLDDVMAGIYTAGLLYLLHFLLPNF